MNIDENMTDFNVNFLNNNTDSTLLDSIIDVSIHLGEITINIKDLFNILPGTCLILKKLYTDPLDIFVNDRLIAQGELVISGTNYGIRITKIINSIHQTLY